MPRKFPANINKHTLFQFYRRMAYASHLETNRDGKDPFQIIRRLCTKHCVCVKNGPCYQMASID